jgi:hypothetical protein
MGWRSWGSMKHPGTQNKFLRPHASVGSLPDNHGKTGVRKWVSSTSHEMWSTMHDSCINDVFKLDGSYRGILLQWPPVYFHINANVSLVVMVNAFNVGSGARPSDFVMHSGIVHLFPKRNLHSGLERDYSTYDMFEEPTES